MTPSLNFFASKARAALAIGICACFAAWVIAQTAGQRPAVGQVNPQVNTELYGGGVPASVRYASPSTNSNPLPSEMRYAYWKSGALPSDIRMGYAALGPITPGGPMSYIPTSTIPGYMPQANTATPAAMGAGAYSNASIRYSSPAPAPSAAYVAPRAVSPAPVSRGPINAGPINNGVIRYAR